MRRDAAEQLRQEELEQRRLATQELGKFQERVSSSMARMF